MDAILQIIRSLGATRLIILGVVTMSMVGLFIYLATRLTTPAMSLLYSDLDPEASGAIIQRLEARGIPYKVMNNGREIRVPTNQVGALRIKLASQGLPSDGSMGYKIFDETDALGTTNFVQNVNLVRALEGELSRTIRVINGVKTARVHLVLPRRELFSREKQEPSASIVLKMSGRGRLNSEQVSAIQHLVATAIPGLNPNHISIIDDKGSLLAAGFEQTGPEASAAKADQRRREFESEMTRRIEDLLERIVGFGKVRAEVSAEIDYDRVVTNRETYDPEGQVVRSTVTLEENANSSETEKQPVTVGGNLPDPTGIDNTEGANASSSENRVQEQTNFEISKIQSRQIRESGVIKRLSVAVLVDGIRTPVENGDDNEFNYEERSEQEMEKFANLVRGAIGFDADRGDTVDVINMRFADLPEPEATPIQLFFGLEKQDLMRMVEILVLSIVAILVILLVIRPLVTRAFEAIPVAVGESAEAKLLAEQAAAAAPALLGPGGEPISAGMEDEEEKYDELIDIDRVEGRVKASSVKKVGEIVDKHPEEALSIIRSWMYQES